MSTNLYRRPCNHEGEYLGYDLKWALADILGTGDGSMGTDGWVVLGKDTVPFLRGVAAAGRGKGDVAKEAKKLIDLIEKHGSVEVASKG